MNSGRGGSRPGSGRPAKYSTSDVVTVKVPRFLKDRVEWMTRAIDDGSVFVPADELLKGIKCYKLHGEHVIRLDDINKRIARLARADGMQSRARRDSARSEAETLDGMEEA